MRTNDVTGQNFCAQYAGEYTGSPNGATLVLSKNSDWSMKLPGGEIILLDRTEQGRFSDSSGNVYVPV